jgi:hypothetical protein
MIMPKSKRSPKRQKKVNGRLKKNKEYFQYDEFEKGYMKTDGESRVCKYDKNHNFLGYATEEESKNF